MKNERDKYNTAPIHHAASFSLFVFGSLIMSEWREGGSVCKIKLFDLLRWSRSPASAFVSVFSNYKPLTQVADRNTQLKWVSECCSVCWGWWQKNRLIAIPLALQQTVLDGGHEQNQYKLSFLLKCVRWCNMLENFFNAAKTRILHVSVQTCLSSSGLKHVWIIDCIPPRSCSYDGSKSNSQTPQLHKPRNRSFQLLV